MPDPAPSLARVRVILLDVWRDMSDAQRRALRHATTVPGSYQTPDYSNARTCRSLVLHGFVRCHGGDTWTLTPMGIALRDVGVRADADAARRRYNRRPAAENTRRA